jgi:hypothetical protein
MAEKIVSPGVFTNEVDQSFLPAGIAAIGAAVIGPTVKGPAMIPTVVSSYSEYQQIFGDAITSGSGDVERKYAYLTSYTAKEYLKSGNTLTVVRILAGDYSVASTEVSTSCDPNIVGGGAPASGTIEITSDDLLGQAGSEVSMSFTVGDSIYTSGSARTVTFIFTGSGWLPVANPNTSTQIYIATSSAEGVAASLRNTINNSSSLHNLEFSASTTGGGYVTMSMNYKGKEGTYDCLDTDFIPTIITSSVKLTSKTFQGGFNGMASASFRLYALSDGATLNSVGPIGTNSVLDSGSVDNFRYEIANRNDKKGTFGLYIRRGDDTQKRKTYLEQWNNLSLDPNSTQFISKVIGDQQYTLRDSGGTSPFLQLSGSYPNKSKYVRVETVETTYNYIDSNGNIRVGAFTGSLPAIGSGSYGGSFSGGSDGTVQHPQGFYKDMSNTNTQGYNLGTAAQGKTSYEDAINILSNQDEYDINLLLLPGLVNNYSNHAAVLTKAVQMCEDRGDCFAIIDPVAYGASLTEATTEAANYDSSYAAMYYPWIQLYDSSVGNYVWTPPSTTVPGVYAFSDQVSAEWFAPAGVNRGTVDTAVQAERKLTHANRDTLYDGNINPIATFPNTGVVVYGQKTLQRKSSALDRVNVRRLLIAAKKFIASASRFLVFEQNSSTTRNRFLNIVNPYLESVQQRQGLYAFKVVMDETNNTPDVIDRNQMVGAIYLQPTKTAEFIIIDFNILPTGAAFPE